MALAMLVTVLTGCTPKPPGCDDPQVAERLRSGIARDGVKFIDNNIDAAGNWKRPGADILRARLDAFGKTIKAELSTITTEGYDSNANRHSCAADLTVAMAGTPMQIKRMAYSIQATSDGKDFVLAVPQYTLILSGVAGGYDDYTLEEEKKVVAAVPAMAMSDSACVAAKMAAFRNKLDQDLAEEAKQAEAKGYQFKGLSPPAMEEWEEKHRAQAKQECP